MVKTAAEREQAWQHLRTLLYDVLLVDVNDGKVQSLQLCRRLRDVGQLVFVLFLLADHDEQLATDAPKAGPMRAWLEAPARD